VRVDYTDDLISKRERRVDRIIEAYKCAIETVSPKEGTYEHFLAFSIALGGMAEEYEQLANELKQLRGKDRTPR